MISAPSNKDCRTATSSWPIVLMANIVRHTKRLTVPRVGLVEEADIYSSLGMKLNQLLLSAHDIGVPICQPQSLPLSVLGCAAIMDDEGNDMV